MDTQEPGFLLKMILDKLDSIDRKIDGHSEKLVSHEVRLAAVEKRQDEQATAKSESWKLWVGLAIAVISAALSWLLPLITK
ncbi:hypothetical protein ACWEF6_01965 [Amycolatopsis sp. NPDC004772]